MRITSHINVTRDGIKLSIGKIVPFGGSTPLMAHIQSSSSTHLCTCVKALGITHGFTSLVVNNFAVSWDNLQQRGWEWTCCFPLCKVCSRPLSHLFPHCHFTKEVWVATTRLLTHRISWEGIDFNQALEKWVDNAKNEDQALALEVIKSISLANNKSIVHDKQDFLYRVFYRLKASRIRSSTYKPKPLRAFIQSQNLLLPWHWTRNQQQT
jgi:hypothetical protein